MVYCSCAQRIVHYCATCEVVEPTNWWAKHLLCRMCPLDFGANITNTNICVNLCRRKCYAIYVCSSFAFARVWRFAHNGANVMNSCKLMCSIWMLCSLTVFTPRGVHKGTHREEDDNFLPFMQFLHMHAHMH